MMKESLVINSSSRVSINPSVTASIVLYNNDREVAARSVQSLLGSQLIQTIYLVDHSSTDRLRVLANDVRVKYTFQNTNRGFGAGHNVAIQAAFCEDNPAYHAIVNPDVEFEAGVVERLIATLESQADHGLVGPLVVSADQEIQHLCRDYPDPLTLFGRRFLLKSLLKRRIWAFELRAMDYRAPAEVPIVSGCFMIARMSALQQVNGFDERFFLYMEDYDLCLALGQAGWRICYEPRASITHHHGRHSYKSLRPLAYHVRSAVKFFNKWGWIKSDQLVGNDLDRLYHVR